VAHAIVRGGHLELDETIQRCINQPIEAVGEDSPAGAYRDSEASGASCT
jgi:hypothetical protein